MEKETDKQSQKTVRIFSIASFMNDMGSDIIAPIWPIFLTTVLGANMEVLGLVDGLGDAVVSLSKAISGYWSDKIRNRKVFVWTGYLFGGLSRLGYALSTTWIMVIPFRILDRAGKIRGSPRDAMVADISKDTNRAKNFGVIEGFDNAGAVVGILISILLIRFLPLRTIFVVAAFPSAISVLLILKYIKERRVDGERLYKGLSFKDLNFSSWLFLVLNAIFALGAFSYSFLLIFASKMGFAVTTIPILYLIYSAVAAISAREFGRLADLIGRKPVLSFSFIFWGLVPFIAIFYPTFIGLVLIFVLFGLHSASLNTVQKTVVAEFAPVEYRASFLGAFQMVIGLVALPASLFAGILWDRVSIQAPFYFSLGLTIIALIMLQFVKKK
ncbi:MAG TPA: MFS transporter [Patescibacteria group bacterium]|nr:MFS transporter [Patescibacteria group bacterium]